VAATLLIRFSTLWFGVGLGLIALTFMQRRLGSLDKIASAEPDAASSREAIARSEG
jgi:hypothetical protein